MNLKKCLSTSRSFLEYSNVVDPPAVTWIHILTYRIFYSFFLSAVIARNLHSIVKITKRSFCNKLDV